jgi:AcrR family transcriptional regulator
MTRPARTSREQPVTRDAVVEAALRLVEEHDVPALSMRRLAAELGTAVTAIYWHVGNRDALVDLMLDRLVAEMGEVRVTARSPRRRIASLLVQWRARLWEHPHLIALAHERGRTAGLFQPVQAALAGELAAVGVTGARAARVIRALQVHVVSSVVLQRTAGRGPHTPPTDPGAWGTAADPALVTALAEPVDYDDVFTLGVDALLDRLLR